MSKIISFIVIIPFLCLIIFKAVLFYEFDTKQRYLKDLTDNVIYKVKITGVLTQEEYDEFNSRINEISRFDAGSIIVKKGNYVDGLVNDWTNYAVGNNLSRGQAFMIFIKSSDVSLYSRLHNGGVMSLDEKNLHYVAKAQCRIEKDY